MTYGLRRLLRHENNWADLICYLAEHDPEPLREALRLTAGTLAVQREATVKTTSKGGKGPKGRADLVVYIDGVPCALLELKMGAGVHGQQLAVYDTWCDGIGIPPHQRYLVGPNEDPIPGAPSSWSQKLSIKSLMAAWASSRDVLARLLSAEAVERFVELEEEASGPADAASSALSDALRLRRLADLANTEAPAGTVFSETLVSRSGAPNLCAWREVDGGYVVVEMQRQNPRNGTHSPFELRLMVEAFENTAEANAAMAEAHDVWLARSSMISHGNRDSQGFRRLFAEADADGFKTGNRRGHPRYYGYKGAGLGSATSLDPSLNLKDMSLVLSSALRYLTTFPSAEQSPAEPGNSIAGA